MNTKEKQIVEKVMYLLENIACGGIGDEGPTIKEMDDLVNKTGQPWDGEADYHTVQYAWRLLQRITAPQGR